MRWTMIVPMAFAAASLAACAAPPPSASSRAPVAAPSYDGASPADTTGQARPAPPPKGRPSLETLPGMRGSELTTLMGAPQFRRRDGQAEIWQYRGSACTLDVFLYTDGSDLRVRYVEARGSGNAQGATETGQARTCAGSLLDARRGSAG
jgi:hypothetical protein